MTMKYTHTALKFALMAAAMLTSCSQTEDIARMEENETPVRIMPSVGGQEFSINETRAVGPFEKWSDTPTLWQNADFYTFALECYNHLCGEADYTKRSDVMYNQLMHIVNSKGEVAFINRDAAGVDTEAYRYYSNWRSKRYKFFTYFTDDAVIDTTRLRDNKDKITARIVSIDGHQDLMHGFAYHTDAELQQLVDNMDEGQQKDIFKNGNGGREFLYSGMAGNRDIHPRFHLNHLLCRFDVSVQGMMGTNDKHGFLRVLVDTVAINAPTTATLTIADSTWNDETTYKAAVDNQEILVWDNGAKDYYLNILQQNMTNGGYESGVDYSALETHLATNGLLPNHAFHQVSSTDAQPLCESALLPVTTDSIDITLSYLYIFAHYDAATTSWIVNDDEIRDRGRWPTHVRLGLPEGHRFTPGHKYSILLKIYGPEEVTATVVGLDEEQWIYDKETDLEISD